MLGGEPASPAAKEPRKRRRRKGSTSGRTPGLDAVKEELRALRERFDSLREAVTPGEDESSKRGEGRPIEVEILPPDDDPSLPPAGGEPESRTVIDARPSFEEAGSDDARVEFGAGEPGEPPPLPQRGTERRRVVVALVVAAAGVVSGLVILRLLAG